MAPDYLHTLPEYIVAIMAAAVLLAGALALLWNKGRGDG